LGGDDPTLLVLALTRTAADVDLVASSKDHPAARAHAAKGGTFYCAEGDSLVRFDARGASSIAPLEGDASTSHLLALVAAERVLSELRERQARWAAWSPPTYLSSPRAT